jgi:pyridinium-3,5-bisthiocarboxylic acid mononucleotide nickel chelatase
VLSVLCPEAAREAVVQAVFRHTSTFGVRWSRWERATARRRSVPVEVGPAGATRVVTVKVADDPEGHLPLATPELAEAEAAAAALGWPVRAVLEAALAAYRERA